MKLLKLSKNLILHQFSDRINYCVSPPSIITYSITPRCDSRCRTCSYWKIKGKRELDTRTWKRIIRGCGDSLYWVTITGGNQFLRKDFFEIFKEVVDHNKPDIITIPISGTLPDLVESNLKIILDYIKKKDIKIFLNFSLDGIGELHDKIRGKKGAFENTIRSYFKAKNLANKNIYLCTNTTISVYNYKYLEEIFDYIKNNLKPKNAGFELAENREELRNMDQKLLPPLEEIPKILEKCKRFTNSIHGSFGLKKRLRSRYYSKLKSRFLQDNHKSNCMAGIVGIFIGYDGTVYQCCVKQRFLGVMMENKYNIRKVINSKQAKNARMKMKKEGCYCTQVTANYF